ncbi:MAG TPA: hypothetical protein VJB94_04420 [Candidatus Nanoarchaeia archaeon]|nr:hypothetical protein [Candidatus Nanoarchaeia archaeon]
MSLATVIFNLLSLAFFLVSFIYIVKKRKKEDESFASGVNVLLFGMFVFLIALLINFMADLRATFKLLLLPAPYVTALTESLNIWIMPLVAVCFIVSILVFKDNLPKK